MNISLKNPFAKLTSATSPAPGVLNAEDYLKGKQMLCGRTKATVETFTADLDTAQRALVEAETAEGECLVDGRDAKAATEARHQADDRVRAAKAALSVAIEKNQIALTAKKQAATDAKRESLRALLVQLNDVGRTVDASIASVTQALDMVLPLMRAVDAYGDSEINYRNKNASLAFSERLLAACVPMPGCSISLHVMRTPGKTWSDSLPTPDQADQAVR